MGKRKKYLKDDAFCCACCCCTFTVIFYLLYSFIISVYPQYEFSFRSSDNGDYLFQHNHFVFVGGLHQTGTSVTERLLSSQPFASGLRADLIDIHNRTACVKPDYHNEYRCLAPENEGIFLTKEFQKYYQSAKVSCSIRGHEDYGHCADVHHMTELDFRRMGTAKSNLFRSNVFRDWGYFWNTSKPFLIEKDISNLVKSRFLQSLFGDKRTAFVFLLRHPLADCKDFKCDVELHLTSWLKALRKLEEDLPYLNNYVVIHQEGYIFNASSIVETLKHQLGWPYLNYADEKEPLTIENGLVDLYKHQILKNKYEALDRPIRHLIFHSNDTIDVQDYTVVIRPTQSTIDWINSYRSKLYSPSNWQNKAIIESMAHHLEHFCYSIHTLIPICKDNAENKIHHTYDDVYNSSIGYSYIWKRGVKRKKL